MFQNYTVSPGSGSGVYTVIFYTDLKDARQKMAFMTYFETEFIWWYFTS